MMFNYEIRYQDTALFQPAGAGHQPYLQADGDHWLAGSCLLEIVLTAFISPAGASGDAPQLTHYSAAGDYRC
jgi:hypothetical protein